MSDPSLSVRTMEFVLLFVVLFMWWSLSRAHNATRRAQAEALAWREIAEGHGGQGQGAAINGLIFCEVDGFAYWKDRGRLVRSPMVSGCADFQRAVPVDPRGDLDLAPATVIEILEALESAQARSRNYQVNP